MTLLYCPEGRPLLKDELSALTVSKYLLAWQGYEASWEHLRRLQMNLGGFFNHLGRLMNGQDLNRGDDTLPITADWPSSEAIQKALSDHLNVSRELLERWEAIPAAARPGLRPPPF